MSLGLQKIRSGSTERRFQLLVFFLGETALTVDSDHSDDLQLGQDQIGAESKGGEESRQAKVSDDHEGSELTLHEPIINRHAKATITPVTVSCHHAAILRVGRLLSSGVHHGLLNDISEETASAEGVGETEEYNEKCKVPVML